MHLHASLSQLRALHAAMDLQKMLTLQTRKGVSFLSRIMGNKKRDEATDTSDNVSELMDNREAGTYAEVFSQPIGFIPKFPPPPRYIRVKTQNRTKRTLDRLFLAQILSESAPRSRKASSEVDSKIHSINDRPVVQPHNSTRTVNNAVWAAEISKDGQYFAAAGQDKKVKVWRIISSKEDREGGESEDEQQMKLNAPVFNQELVREYEGHASAILDLSWSKNNFLLSSSMDKTVRLYHISRPECLCAFKHNDFVTSISFHPRDDRFFLAGSLDSKIRLWSIPDKNVAYWAQAHDMVTAVAFTPDGKTAIAGTLSGLCTLYDTEGLKAHSQIHVRSNRGKNSKGSKITGIETIHVARALGPPDVKILITSNDSRIRMYNLRDKSLEAKFRGNENSTSQIRASFSDDGKYVICGSEDKKVYVWSTEPIERQDSDKRPVEIFEAHTAAVTTALLLPTRSRRILARSGDPIYDLCNPPPIRLRSRTDSVLSSQAPTQNSGSEDQAPANQKSESPQPARIEETPQHAARHSHNHCGGFILVTGDYTGEIKVFRQDCAYQKRREGSWDSLSFSKKMLGRNGSVATRTSERSSIYRKSMTFNEPRSPANDNIIDWRNSVMSAKSTSAATSTSEFGSSRFSFSHERDRSASPNGQKRGLAHRFSLRHGSTPLANSSRPSTDDSQRMQTPPAQQQPHTQAEAQPNGRNTSPPHPHYYSVLEHSDHFFPISPSKSQTIPDVSITASSPQIGNDEKTHARDKNGSGLYLDGDQSYMAWDIKTTMMPMANAQPRTPGPAMMPNRDAMSREVSFVSQLSSEIASTASATPLEEGDETHGASALGPKKEEEEDLKCKRCGNESFMMVKREGGVSGQALRCRRCGQEV